MSHVTTYVTHTIKCDDDVVTVANHPDNKAYVQIQLVGSHVDIVITREHAYAVANAIHNLLST